MAVNTYEGMFLLDSTKVAVSWDDSVKHVHDILAKHKSEIVASRQWDERRLAYPVEGHKKGTYLLTYFKTDGSNLKEIVADCHLSDADPPRADPEGPPQARRPPGHPGDDLDPTASEEAAARGRARRPPPPPPPRRLNRSGRRADRSSTASRSADSRIQAGVDVPDLTLVGARAMW